MTGLTGEWLKPWLQQRIFVHCTAVVDDGAKLGVGCYVWHFAHVRGTAQIGAESTIGQGCYIDASVVIGSQCKIANGVQVYQGATIGNGVFIGPNTTFTNDLWPRSTQPDGQVFVLREPAKTVIRDGASIGAGCVILPVEIGERAMIAAGSVVTTNVPPNTRYLCRLITESTPLGDRA
jgi:UDP-2-acetamido-3-amino-2,3-dideoxy-glucuronate N-acetyltransferase